MSDTMFYDETLTKLIKSKKIDPSKTTLVVAGTKTDADVLASLNFSNVIITNLPIKDEKKSNLPAGFKFEEADAEFLCYTDASFENVIVHAALHHCASPHRALTEMYRVSSKNVLVFESRDSIVMRIAQKLGLAERYEFGGGGIRGTSTPNFVYRWTEREVYKTIRSFDPSGEPKIEFFYGLRFPWSRIMRSKKTKKRLMLISMAIPARLFQGLVKKQGNQLGILISKPPVKFPWIGCDGGLDPEWLKER